jgi:hypothetical protein
VGDWCCTTVAPVKYWVIISLIRFLRNASNDLILTRLSRLRTLQLLGFEVLQKKVTSIVSYRHYFRSVHLVTFSVSTTLQFFNFQRITEVKLLKPFLR